MHIITPQFCSRELVVCWTKLALPRLDACNRTVSRLTTVAVIWNSAPVPNLTGAESTIGPPGTWPSKWNSAQQSPTLSVEILAEFSCTDSPLDNRKRLDRC